MQEILMCCGSDGINKRDSLPNAPTISCREIPGLIIPVEFVIYNDILFLTHGADRINGRDREDRKLESKLILVNRELMTDTR